MDEIEQQMLEQVADKLEVDEKKAQEAEELREEVIAILQNTKQKMEDVTTAFNATVAPVFAEAEQKFGDLAKEIDPEPILPINPNRHARRRAAALERKAKAHKKG